MCLIDPVELGFVLTIMCREEETLMIPIHWNM